MERRASHLDMTEVFCDVDDFCQVFEPLLAQMLLPEVSLFCHSPSIKIKV